MVEIDLCFHFPLNHFPPHLELINLTSPPLLSAIQPTPPTNVLSLQLLALLILGQNLFESLKDLH